MFPSGSRFTQFTLLIYHFSTFYMSSGYTNIKNIGCKFSRKKQQASKFQKGFAVVLWWPIDFLFDKYGTIDITRSWQYSNDIATKEIGKFNIP